MRKNGGFIATSLIYSFFLVFIAIISALLSNYIANKTIMERFNTEAAINLNTKKYTVTIYSKNANIRNGMTLTNLVSNGNFSSSAYWQTSGIATFSYANTTPETDSFSLYKINGGYGNSYLYQQLYLLQNSKFYYSISHLNASNSSFRTYIGDASSNYLDTANSKTGAWTKTSGIYETKGVSENRDFNVAVSSGSGSVFMTNAMVINLTASFGRGYEPNKKWIDDNIEYFDGTTSYIRLEQIESKEAVTVKFIPYTGYNFPDIKCRNLQTKGSIKTNDMTERIEGGRIVKEFKIDSVTSDIKCNIYWREKE